MAILLLLRFKGDPEELAQKFHARRELMSKVRRPGSISFTCAKMPDGLLMIEEWESEAAAFATTHDPHFEKAQELYPFPAPEPAIGEVLLSVPQR